MYGDSTPAPFREDAVAIEPVSPYAATKRAGELLLQAVAPIYGFRVASLRFFTVYGPRQRPDLAIHAFTRKMVEGETLTLFGDGTQARDYTYCSDIVAGVLAALAWTETAPVGVEHFNLGGNRSVPTMAMVETIAEALGITPSIEWAPDAAGRRAADRGRPHQVVPRCSATCRARRFPRGFGDSFPGTGRPMAGQTERLLARARERFAVQDYYGTVHLLEEIVASGRAFADVHHLLGVALSLLGQRERAVQEFARALELNPRYLEALIHQGLVLTELGREAEAEESFRRASASVAPPSDGLPGAGGGPAGQHPRRAGRGLRRGGRAGTGDRAVSARPGAGARVPRPAVPDGAADARGGAAARRPRSAGGGAARAARISWTRRSRSAWRTTSRATRSGRARSGGACLTRRPENARVDAYLAMLGRTGG